MNIQLWNMYKNSDEGKKVISLFDFKDGISYDELQEVANFSEKWGGYARSVQI